MLFEGINRIYRDYGVFDYPRSGGSRHNGMDIDGVNSFVIRMPSFCFDSAIYSFFTELAM